MKKILSVVVLSLFLISIVRAQKVTEQQALEKAKEFMKGKTFSSDEMSFSRAKGRGRKDADDAFYIFNADDNNGFVIVSGDERTEEILGYSDSGHIDLDNMPENLVRWLDYYNNTIKTIDYGQCQRIKRSEKPAVAPLIKTKWDLFVPYNQLCPERNGKICPTGCTATAMAQVMYYYKWPEVETAELQEYWDNCAKENMPALPATTFDWDKMSLAYTSTDGEPNYSQEEGEAVAKLMRYCGHAVEMKYDTDESEATVYPKDLIFKFWYSRKTNRVFRSDYSTPEWEDMMYKEVSEGRPVLYTAYPNSNSGHEFICDGYDGKGLFHINWGWSGRSDGYFVLNILNPNNEGADAGINSEGYSSNHIAVIGLEPNYYEDSKEILYFSLMSHNFPKRTSVEHDFQMSFSLNAYYAYNHTKFEGEYCLAVFQEDQLTETLLPVNGTVYDDNATATLEFVFGANWTKPCTVKLFYRKDSSDEWKDAYYLTYNYSPEDLQVPDSFFYPINTFLWTSSKINRNVDMTVNSITFDNELVSGEKNYATINVTNTGDSYELPMYIDIDGKSIAACSAWLSPQETGEVRISFTPEAAGEKKLEIRSAKVYVCSIDGTSTEITKYYYSEVISVKLGSKLELDGIYYEVNWDNKELEVIYKFGLYTGDLIIPESVDYEGETFKVTSIGTAAFSSCSLLTSIIIPSSVTSIGSSAFQRCFGLTSITIPNGVIKIGSNAFWNCRNLTSITIPKSVTDIRDNPFYDCNLTSIVVEDGNPKYDSRDNCNAIIETATNTLITGCNETIIPNEVTTIGWAAFRGCLDLSSIAIPKSVKLIRWNAFLNCNNLKTIKTYAIEPICLGSDQNDNSDTVFRGVDKDECVLYVPDHSVEKYQTAEGWKDFKQILPLSTIEDYIISGDADGNFEVNASDIVEIVNYILGKPSERFVKDAADINGDSEVNIADLIMIVSNMK